MSQNQSPGPVQPPPSRRDAILLALIAFVLGIVLAGAWFHHHLQTGSQKSELSPVAKNLMGQLAAPVAIHYYSLLPAGSADESLTNFAGRVSQLLDDMKAASHGKLQVTRIDTPSNTNDDAANAAGIQGFNLDKGAPCFLGLALTSGKSKETFARLQPKWEPALQFDLARAIARVASANAPAKPAPEVAKPSPQTIATIHRLIPDVKTVSVQDANQILHTEYFKQVGEVGAETEALLKKAQQQVVQAQASGSQADIEAARKNLLKAQLDQANKLKNLATQLQIQLEVFKRMKTKTGNGTK